MEKENREYVEDEQKRLVASELEEEKKLFRQREEAEKK